MPPSHLLRVTREAGAAHRAPATRRARRRVTAGGGVHRRQLGPRCHVARRARGGSIAIGWEQAAEAAHALYDSPFDAVVSSDLMRARQTARLIAAGRGLALQGSDQLREVDLGSWTGLTRDEAASRFPDEYRAWRTQPRTARRGGGETELEAGDRVARHLVAVARARPGQTIAVVSHGLVLRSAMRALAAAGAHGCDDPPHLDSGRWLTVTF
jgi:broad specificity phosphatase PhoE